MDATAHVQYAIYLNDNKQAKKEKKEPPKTTTLVSRCLGSCYGASAKCKLATLSCITLGSLGGAAAYLASVEHTRKIGYLLFGVIGGVLGVGVGAYIAYSRCQKKEEIENLKKIETTQIPEVVQEKEEKQSADQREVSVGEKGESAAANLQKEAQEIQNPADDEEKEAWTSAVAVEIEMVKKEGDSISEKVENLQQPPSPHSEASTHTNDSSKTDQWEIL